MTNFINRLLGDFDYLRGHTEMDSVSAEEINHDTRITPGDDIQSKLTDAGTGAKVVIEQGTYQQAGISPESGQTIYAPGAIFEATTDGDSIFVTGNDEWKLITPKFDDAAYQNVTFIDLGGANEPEIINPRFLGTSGNGTVAVELGDTAPTYCNNPKITDVRSIGVDHVFHHVAAFHVRATGHVRAGNFAIYRDSGPGDGFNGSAYDLNLNGIRPVHLASGTNMQSGRIEVESFDDSGPDLHGSMLKIFYRETGYPANFRLDTATGETVEFCHFRSTSSDGTFAARFFGDGTLRNSHVEVIGESASNYGIAGTNGTMTVNNCTFTYRANGAEAAAVQDAGWSDFSANHVVAPHSSVPALETANLAALNTAHEETPRNLSGASGLTDGFTAKDDGTNTASGLPEVCVWDATNSQWHSMGGDTFV